MPDNNENTIREKTQPEVQKKVSGFQILKGADTNTVSIGSNPQYRGKNTINFTKGSRDNTVSIGQRVICNNLDIAFEGNNNQLFIDDDARWVGRIFIVGNNRTVRIGKNSTAVGVYILCRDEDVSIGCDCLFSREIELRTTDAHKVYCLDTGERLNPAQKVVVGDNVWIAARVMLSKGTVIPDGCIVGAASFVNKPFAETNVIIAGTPAKIVKTRVRWER